MILSIFTALVLLCCCSAQEKPKLTLDEFFNYVDYPMVSLSPSGEHLLIETLQPSWNTSTYSISLWLYDIQQQQEQKRMISSDILNYLVPMWSPSSKWIAFFTKNNSATQLEGNEQQLMRVYSVLTDKIISIQIGTVRPLFITWSDNDNTLYFVAKAMWSKEEEDAHKLEWKNVINYRESKPGERTVIYRLDIDTNDANLAAKVTAIANISMSISELLYVPYEQQLVFTSSGRSFEYLNDFDIYSIHLNNAQLLPSKLTSMEGVEQELKLSSDGHNLLFRLWPLSSGAANVTQRRLFALDLINGQVHRLGKDFDGAITQYTVKSGNGVYIVGQKGLEVQIYAQESITAGISHQHGWNGTYEKFTSSLQGSNGPVAFVFSSLEKPKEVYWAENINQLLSAKVLTSNNELFTQRALPQTKGYQWNNIVDNQAIEGILHYPPGQLNGKNLPLLVLIHGGPNAASLNEFQANWYNWAGMAASEGYLVFEPNYRGSTGYGDKFLDDIRHRPLSLPCQDILMGVDKLIQDGTADPKRLAVGGYSYGGFLTNFLITQTTRFNAALTGAGDTEHVSSWGTVDVPVLLKYLHGGFPWEVPQIYESESPIYQLNKVRTPTHIVTGESDIRVNAYQSYILERSLHYLGIPVKLLVFPNEGHEIAIDPWNGKIKVREELKWLHKYGNQSLRNGCTENSHIFLVGFAILFIFVGQIYIHLKY